MRHTEVDKSQPAFLPLSELGCRQASSMGLALIDRELLGVSTKILSSPALRCAQTAAMLSLAAGAHVEYWEELDESRIPVLTPNATSDNGYEPYGRFILPKLMTAEACSPEGLVVVAHTKTLHAMQMAIKGVKYPENDYRLAHGTITEVDFSTPQPLIISEEKIIHI